MAKQETPTSAPVSLVRSVRLNEAQIEALLDRLDSDSESRTDSRRRSDRFRFRRPSCALRLQQPGSAANVAYLVPTRNLSAGGMAFLHGSYIHRGSRCSVQLMSAHGAWQDVPGVIVSCRHVESLVHEVGIEFDHEIDVGMFCPDAVKKRVLLVDDDPSISRLAVAHLARHGAEVVWVESGERAIEEVKNGMFDVILMDIEMPGMDGFEATRQLRANGYGGRIVAATGLTGPGDRERCLTAGCDEYIPKPFSRDSFTHLIESLRQEPLFSSMANDESMIEFINAFIEELPGRIRAIEEAVTRHDMKDLEYQTRRLKGEAGSYGFEPITDSARKVENMLRAGATEKDVLKAIEELAQYCLLARSSARQTSAGGGGTSVAGKGPSQGKAKPEVDHSGALSENAPH